MEIAPMLFQPAMLCLIGLSVSVLIAHAELFHKLLIGVRHSNARPGLVRKRCSGRNGDARSCDVGEFANREHYSLTDPWQITQA